MTSRACIRWLWLNRALCRELLNRGHDLGLLVGTEGNGVRTADRLPDDPRLSARLPVRLQGNRSPYTFNHELHELHE